MKDIESLSVDEKVAIPLLYTGISEEERNSGSKYYKLFFRDKSGKIEGRMWNTARFSQEYDDFLKQEESQIVEVSGVVVEFRGEPQIKISTISNPSRSDYDISDFVESAPKEPEEYIKDIKYILSKYQDEITPNIRNVIEQLLAVKMDYNPEAELIVLDEEFQKLKKAPAASNYHHARIGGLLQHIHSMIELADILYQKYSFEDLSMELVFAGIILHDIGKKEIYESYISGKKNERQKLCGHIAIAQQKLNEIPHYNSLSDEKSDQLLHILLSHHGKKEWGSPVEPETKEAKFVHRLDMIDSRLDSL